MGSSLQTGGFGALYLRVSTVVVEAVSIAALGFMAAVNAFNIGSRVLFNADHDWAQEISMMAAMVVYFFSITLVAKQRGDIRMDFLVRVLPARWQFALEMLAHLLVLLFQGIVLWFSVITFRFVGMFETPILQWPESVFYGPVILGAADFLITEFIYTMRSLRVTRPA